MRRGSRSISWTARPVETWPPRMTRTDSPCSPCETGSRSRRATCGRGHPQPSSANPHHRPVRDSGHVRVVDRSRSERCRGSRSSRSSSGRPPCRVASFLHADLSMVRPVVLHRSPRCPHRSFRAPRRWRSASGRSSGSARRRQANSPIAPPRSRRSARRPASPTASRSRIAIPSRLTSRSSRSRSRSLPSATRRSSSERMRREAMRSS